MSQSAFNPLRWLSVPYRPDPQATSFLERAVTRASDGTEAQVAVLSDAESKKYFGVRLARKGIQPVWVRIVNHTDTPLRLDLYGIDPACYTPLEAAWVCHYSAAKRLAGFGLLSWLFLPLLPLVPFKYLGARSANLRMNQLFKQHGFNAGPIGGKTEKSGFVFTTLDEGVKHINLQLYGNSLRRSFSFSIDVPGLSRSADTDNDPAVRDLQETSLDELRAWVGQQARCTTNRPGTREGDPLNLVVVGSRAMIIQCFGARWDEVETINFSTCFKTARAFLLDSEYRYSPVSPLFHEGQQQALALQKARANIDERLHLRLWRTARVHQGEPVWIGQISRDIGVRFTLRTWNLTTHKIDPDVDEARDYLLGSLLAVGRVARLAYAPGVDAANEAAPRRNLTGDPYYTDGFRAVIILAPARTEPVFLNWV